MKKYMIYTFVAVVFLTSSVSAQYGNPVSVATQSASVWQSILNFLGLSNQDDAKSDNNNVNENILDSSDIIRSVDTEAATKVGANFNMKLDSTFSNNISGTYIKCLPAKARENEPALLVFSCPKSFEMIDNNFNSSLDHGIIHVSAENKTYYIDCKNNENKIERYECSFDAYSPAIVQFYITPSNPSLGDLVKLSYETRDMLQCKLFKGTQLVKGDLSGTYVFKYTKEVDIYLICEGKDGFLVKKELKI